MVSDVLFKRCSSMFYANEIKFFTFFKLDYLILYLHSVTVLNFTTTLINIKCCRECKVRVGIISTSLSRVAAAEDDLSRGGCHDNRVTPALTPPPPHRLPSRTIVCFEMIITRPHSNKHIVASFHLLLLHLGESHS